MAKREKQFTSTIKDSDIVREFNVENWLDWLDDVLIHKVAYPFYNLSPDGDVIVEVVNYLRNNSIPLSFYERALTICVSQRINPFSNVSQLERLIDALSSVKGIKSVPLLIKIIKDRSISHLKGNNGFIISTALNSIARASSLSDTEKSDIQNHVCLHGLKDMGFDPAYVGNFLRFSYLHYDNVHFFESLNVILALANSDSSTEDDLLLRARLITVLTDKFDEVHYRSISTFYSSFFNWFIKNCFFLKSNDLFDSLISNLCELMMDEDSLGSFDEVKFSNLAEIQYAKSLRFFLLVFAKFDYKLDNLEVISSIAFVLNSDDHLLHPMKILLTNSVDYVFKYYRVIPFRVIETLEPLKYNNFLIQKVIDLFDDALNTPSQAGIEQKPAYIRKVLENKATSEMYKCPPIIIELQN
ncbi:MAG: hypothetical protein ABI370_13490, partial [Gammaproteobacteria bacterium]